MLSWQKPGPGERIYNCIKVEILTIIKLQKGKHMKYVPMLLAVFLRVTAAIFVQLLVWSTVFAQITVTNATFPIAGDTLKMAIDNFPSAGVTITPPGGNQNWNFTSLQVDSNQNIIYRLANEGSVQVPGAELFTNPSPNMEEYFNVTNNRFELQAHYGLLYDIALNSLFRYNPPLVERRAPLNFFDINQSSSAILEVFPPEAFPPALIAALIDSLPASPDSLRYRITINQLEVVDGWGDLSIPEGNYHVLREKRTQYKDNRLDAKLPTIGWIDITDAAIQAGFQGLGIDTTVAYYFHNNVEKEPIAIVHTSSNHLIVKYVTFKDSRPPVSNAETSDNNIPDGYVFHGNYPNPFNPTTTLWYEMPERGEVWIDIYNVLGNKVRTFVNGQLAAGQHTLVWDAKDDSGNQVSSGIYLVRMYAKGIGNPVVMTHKMVLMK